VRIYITLHGDDERLAKAYAKDRGIPVGTLAKAAFMGDVKRTVNRSHLREAVLENLKEWALENIPLVVSEAQMVSVLGKTGLLQPQAHPARAEGQQNR